jgi:copper chaperone CopZ
MSQITLLLPDLRRPSQARHVEDAVRRVRGVHAAVADPDQGVVVVTYDPARISAWPLVAAIEQRGVSVGGVLTASDRRRSA